MTPPLSQSRHADLACAFLYIAKHIYGLQLDSPASARGTEIHDVIAEYMEALKISHQKTDYKKFEALSAGSSEEAKDVLERFCESWMEDSEKIYDTEIYIGLDDEFKVVEAYGKAERKTAREKTYVEGMLDLVVMESEEEATIYDWKSYYQIVNADSFQSKLYPLLLFMFNPGLERIRFVLAFVRYGDAQRDVTYTRTDVPKLQELVRRERKRQLQLHDWNYPELVQIEDAIKHIENVTEFEASPGRQCIWCPLLLYGCPMIHINPYAQLEPSERLALSIWMAAAKKENDRILKEEINQEGPVTYRDANGTGYVAAFGLVEKRYYPADQAVPVLQEWANDHPGDKVLEMVTIGGLTGPLKAKKREALAKQLESVAAVKKETRVKIAGTEDLDEDSDSDSQ